MEYPFVKCLNPQSIVNPYNNERLVVECGRCKACRVRKGQIQAMKCKLESLSHEKTMFVTLTYSNEYVPLMDVHSTNIECIEGHNYIPKMESDLLVCCSERLGVGEILGKSDSLPKYIDRLKKKTNINGLIPYLNKRDCQLFLKRLRKYISKYETKERIRYYLVGEYGPVHYRPHYHVLLWFSSSKIYEVIEQAVRSSWTYGRVDVETSRGLCADYVAKYVNSNNNLPRVYHQKKTKPFSLHSIHLGEMVLKKSIEEIYSLPTREVVSRSIPLGNVVADVNLWRSLKVVYFPRCKNYALRDRYERLQAYGTFLEAKRIYGTESPTEQVDNILSDIVQFNKDFELLDVNPFTDFDKSKERLVRYFIKSCKINPNDLYERESYLKYFRKVYMELRLSKHFFEFCCQGKVENMISTYERIERFWSEVDYMNLTKQYENMEVFCENWFSSEEDLQLFYCNIPHDMELYKTKPYYQNLHFNAVMTYENSVKHKKLNDMNDIFADK